jgi:transposase
LKSRAAGFIPSKVNPENQSIFLSGTLKPAIEKAKAGLLELFFMGASHFVMGGIPGRLWGKVRLWVRTSSGRKRYNVLGALNFASKKIETVMNDSYITSTQVVQLLEELAAKYIGKPIAIILDNARYQHCNFVISKAAELDIQLLFLPTYSPNLNLIERVWKFVKAQVLNAVYIETFEEYCSRIENFVKTIEIDCAGRMASLVTEKFQLFDKCKSV